MNRLAFSAACFAGLALASTAVAQSPAPSGDQPQPDTSSSDTNTNNTDSSNQAGPTETNTNGGGLTREGNVIDRTGQSTTDPANATAPTNEQVRASSDTIVTTPAYSPAAQTEAAEYPGSTWDRLGVGLAAGGGASGFTNDTLRGATNVGGDWDVRLTLGTRTPLAAEFSYIGSAQRIDALGLDNDAMLVGNGAQGALRLNALPGEAVTPFVFAGAAWRHYNVTNTEVNTSDIRDSDDVLEVPVGVGVAGHVGGLLVDLRGEFRASAFEDLTPRATGNEDGVVFDTSDPNAGMSRWGVNASIGAEF